MKFILTTGWDDGLAYLTERLVKELAAGKQVLWLVSGGSNVEPSVQVMDSISPKLSRNLTIMLADERFGPVGHRDSNWAQLLKAGFKTKKARVQRVLKRGLDFRQTLKHYNQIAEEAFKDKDLVIAQLGIGEDGHIAGILPGSAAAKEKKKLIAGFKTATYNRMTLTFAGLNKIHIAFVFAFGESKKNALRNLRYRAKTPNEQPAQILKNVPETYIYNDQMGAII